MALEQKLNLRMTQKLIMTPSLQQAIKLLQMTKLELQEEVTQELTENPLLEELQEGATEADKPEGEDGQVAEGAPAADAEVPDKEPERRRLRPRRSGIPSTRSITSRTSRITWT